ncbi:phosphotransferase [Pseudoalteromonas sp. XMcav11-Q]|uniref:phosphotransferase n=1 Tax=Pseudoalteromonas sp. XMcav11-Q TaxID=3136665 RepID=UPI0032C43A23
MESEIEEVLRELKLSSQDLRIELMENGIASKNYHIRSNDEEFLIKLDSRGVREHQLDLSARNCAQKAGVSVPKTLSITSCSSSILEFINGDDFNYLGENVSLLAKTQASLHNVTPPPFVRKSVYSDITIDRDLTLAIDNKYPLKVVNIYDVLYKAPENIISPLFQCGNLTHCDLKPDNILKYKGSVTLLDWEKSCSCSREMDLILALMFLIADNQNIDERLKIFCNAYLNEIDGFLNSELILDALKYVPLVFLFRDAGLAISKSEQRRVEYVDFFVYPMLVSWYENGCEEKIRNYLL